MSVGFNLVSSAMNKVLGAQIITDVQTFVTAFEALFGGFRQRATQTFELLSSGTPPSWWSPPPSATRCARRPTSSTGSPKSACRCRAW